MNTIRPIAPLRLLACSMLLFATLSAGAQTTNIVIANFDTEAEVTSPPWGNWFGMAFSNCVFDATSDASNNPSSGSLKITALFPDAGVGGCCGPQYVVYNQNDGISPPINGMEVTNFQCDVRFDPGSATSGGTFGNLEFGTRGTGFGQPNFGAIQIPSTQTNWVHVSLPVNAIAQPQHATIPNVFVKMFSTALSGTAVLWVDNIKFVGPAVAISNPPPTLTVQKATPSLRIFAGSTAQTYDREEVATVDQNQSWIGGTYPVTYSFTLLNYPAVLFPFQFHIFLIPVNTAGNNMYNNQFIDFQASNSLWLQIQGSTANITCNVSWKTNLPNANPNNVAVNITNATAVGTWTLTFNSDTTGTLTAPGASPVPFTLPADVAPLFANPLVAYIGLQPNSGIGAGIGQYVDVSKIAIQGVAGVNVNDDFTTASIIDPVYWDITCSAQPSSLVLVTTNHPVWVNWTTPDTGFGLGTKASLSDTVTPWYTPAYFAGYGADSPVITQMGVTKWTLIANPALPTVDGSQLGVPSPIGLFRLSNPPPAN